MDPAISSDSLLLRFVGQLSAYAVVILDTDGRIVSWNAGAEQLKGYSKAEVIGEHFSIFYTPEALTVGHPERELMITAAAGRFEEDGWRVRKDGTRFWAHVILTALVDDDGVLRGFGKIAHDITESKQAADQMANVTALLETTCRTDFLTGLDNRRSLDKELADIIALAKRHDRPFVLAMLDIDRFKAYNDAQGHQNGDRYLRKAAFAWRRQLRQEDVLARYGGEEFTVVMPETRLATALVALNRVRHATPEALTCSIGVAEWDGRETADMLINRADRSLYAAKSGGRNRVEEWRALHLVSAHAPEPAGNSEDKQSGAL